MTSSAFQAKIHWNEPDVLRGIAAILMIINHVGVTMLAPAEVKGSLAEILIFIGSFAPVVFFFVTGIGYGIQSSQKKKEGRWLTVLFKIGVLFWADLLLHWSSGEWIGLDFLGFIGLSVLLLETLRQSKYPLTFCLIGIILITGLRYGIGPHLPSSGYDQHWILTDWIFGTTAVPNVSYPLSPWMVYPLVGYVLGTAATCYRSFIKKYPTRVISSCVVTAAFLGIASLILAQRGASFSRWGTMSIGFYIISFAALASGIALSLGICADTRFKAVQNAASLRGVASLAVVPVHYFLIEFLINAASLKNLNSFSYGLICTAVLITSFLLARLIESLSQKIHQINTQNLLWFGLVSILLLAFSVTLAYADRNEFLATASRTLGQIILCLMLSARLPIR